MQLMPYWAQPRSWRIEGVLPVAGFSDIHAQSTLFALQQCIAGNDEEDIALQWLEALQCAQAFSDRLLRNMEEVEHALAFWNQRLAGSSHRIFMLLGLGPFAFADQVKHLAMPHANHLALRLIPRLLELSLAIPASLIEYLPSGIPETLQHLAGSIAAQLQGFTDAFATRHPQRVHGTASPGSVGAVGSTGSIGGPAPEDMNATDRMQQRVLMLQAIRAALAEAIARVHAAARLLLLDVHALGRAQRARAGTPAAPSFAASGVQVAVIGADDGSRELLLAAREATRAVVSELSSSLIDLHAKMDAAALDAPSSNRAALHHAAVSRTLTGSPSLTRATALLSATRTSASGHAASVSAFAAHSERSATMQTPTRTSSSITAQQRDSAHHRHQRESYPEPQILQRLASAEMQQIVQQRAQELAALADQLGIKLASTQRHTHGNQHSPDGHSASKMRLSAKEALDSAKMQAILAGHLVHLPQWVKRPSRLERHWLRFTFGGLATLWVLRFLYRHSALAGSDDLSRWTQAAWQVLRTSWDEHVFGPLMAVRDELTRTFRERPSIVSQEEFEADKQSLLRMLSDFRSDTGASNQSQAGAGPASVSEATVPEASLEVAVPEATILTEPIITTSMTPAEQDEMVAGMHRVMESYEREMRSPVKNLVMGQLVRSLLIQVQRLKLDTEAAMLEMDQILRANELSISLVAAVPSFAISWAAVTALYRWLMPRAPDAKRAAVPCRMAMADLERSLAAAQEAADSCTGQPGPAAPQAADMSTATPLPPSPLACNMLSAEQDGMCVFQVFRVHKEAVALFQSHDKASRWSEWPSLSEDLLQLAAASTAAQRLAVHQRMMRNFKVFQR